MAIIECVPNISEGRDKARIDAIGSVVNQTKGAKLVSIESDADHNRSVITFAGDEIGVYDAALAIFRKATGLIDLNKHQGEHPRMGAVDVCPFIPVKDVTMEECVKLAKRLGRRVGEELGVPVYLYEAAATRKERKNLADIRKGQFEKLRELIGTDESRVPDFGPNKIHPTAGASAIGARFFLIAFNVNLATHDVDVAKSIAQTIREKDGGMPGVKALGFMLEHEGVAQVSMNLVDYRKTSPAQAYTRIEELAAAKGVKIKESEIVGVVPQESMTVCARQRKIEVSNDLDVVNREVAESLKVKGYTPKMVLENHLS